MTRVVTCVTRASRETRVLATWVATTHRKTASECEEPSSAEDPRGIGALMSESEKRSAID
jgi:hypothetical protein